MPLNFHEIRARISTAAAAGLADSFALLREVSGYLNVTKGTSDEHLGQALVIRLLDVRHIFDDHAAILDSLRRESGLFPY
ncbi:hypothetical protein Q2317_26035, partial [Escherichia coli]|nr:hypothetical protein [Escherichia coli]